jgi:hypothetical protein
MSATFADPVTAEFDPDTPEPVTAELNPSTPLMGSADWLREALSALERLRLLRENWDSYGSPPIAEPAVSSSRLLLLSLARNRLPAPDIRPVAGGGLQLEWRTPTRELEIGILPDGRCEFLAVFEGNEMVEGTLPSSNRLDVSFLFRSVFQTRA